MRCFRFLVLATVATLGVFLAPEFASAHDLQAKVTVAEVVKVEAYFDEVLPAQKAEVAVTNADGATVLTGQTDDRGVCTFPLPSPGEYVLTVVESAGHVAKVRFRVEGEPEASTVVYTGWRLNKTVGLAIGLTLLLGLSAASWFIRYRRRG